MNEKWLNKVAVITGGAGGIGIALAENLYRKGCAIALVDINDEALNNAKTQLQAINPSQTISLHNCDVSSEDAIKQLVVDVLAQHGRVDFLFNNAGIAIVRSFENHDIAHWKKVIDINLWSVIYGCKYFLPALKETKGSIINTSSLAGLLGMPYQASYSLTKMAVKSLSETLYAELAVSDVHVLVVHPGAIKTPCLEKAIEGSDNPELTAKLNQLTASTAITPEKLAARVVKALSKRKQRCVVGADAHAVDAIKRVIPSLVHSLFATLFKKFYR
ncbi:MAG: SDR family oxidoreductase [Sinobacterium sp.]|nr:SDR family oxidoreductase [Sinobacterium sp.]